MQGVLHRPQRGLGIVTAVQVVAATHLQDDPLCHDPPSYTSSRTTAAALAITVEPVRASLAISSPPSPTFPARVPGGTTASTCALSTSPGFGTPTVTSTSMESTCSPTASATLSELCHSASRSARTAALV